MSHHGLTPSWLSSLAVAGLAGTLVMAGCGDGDRAAPASSSPSASSSPTPPAAAPAEEPSEAEVRNDNFVNKLDGAALLTALRKGGYVIFFRHGQTEKDYADQVSASMGDCSTQRMLSEAGWRQAHTIGKAFVDKQIPVGEVFSSQYCRAWQTADIAFGRYEPRAELNFAPSDDYTDSDVATMRAGILPFLSEIPQPGTNTVVVGHDDVFEAATAIYPAPQGVAYVVAPKGNGQFDLIARIQDGEWALL